MNITFSKAYNKSYPYNLRLGHFTVEVTSNYPYNTFWFDYGNFSFVHIRQSIDLSTMTSHRTRYKEMPYLVDLLNQSKSKV